MKRQVNFLKPLYEQREILIAVIVTVMLSALSVFIYVNTTKQDKDDSKNSIQVSTTVTPASNENVAQKGETLNWQKSVTSVNETGNIDGTIIEEIDQNQNFAGNLQLPKGWTVEYSIDSRSTPENQRTYSATQPADPSTVTFLKITTGTAQTLKPYTQSPLVQPLDELSLNNGSFKTLPPILFDNKIFQVMQAVTVEDAGSENDITFNCFDLTTYEVCSDVTFPTYLSTNVGPLGQGTKNINTPLNMKAYIDDGTYGNKGRLYMPGQTGNSYGVVCVDLISYQNCGFTSLGTSGAGVPGVNNPVLLSGFIEKSGKLYGHANDADKTRQTVVCYDLNSNGQGSDAPCSDFNADTLASTTTYRMVEHANAYLTTGNHVMSGNRMYWIVNYSFRNSHATTALPPADSQRSWGTVMTCFDVSTKAHCTDWPNTRGGSNLYSVPNNGLYLGLERPTTLFAWKNTDGSDKAVCLFTGLASSGDPLASCREITNGTALNNDLTTPDHPQRMFPSQWLFVYWTGSPYVTNLTDEEGNKSYFAFYNTQSNSVLSNPNKGATFCWNWSTQSSCQNFAKPRYWHEINNGQSGDTGYIYDGSCMWGVGYGNKMWSFNSKTGEAPCRVARNTNFNAELSPEDFYCDGQDHVFNWGKVRFAKGSTYDFERLDVTVRNSSGQTVLQEGDLKDVSELDLSSIEYDSNENLKVDINATVYNTSPWAHDNLPYINIISNSDSAQYCFQTKAKEYCDIANISTLSNASVETELDTLTSSKSTTIPLNQPSNEQCFEDVKVSVSSDKTQIRANENITYTIKVENKANTNDFNRGIINGAQIEATYSSLMGFVSATNNGNAQGAKTIWQNQIFQPQEIKEYKVTLRAPASLSSLKNGKGGVVYAATTQTPLALQAAAIYNGDVNQSDNSSQSQSVILITETPDSTPPAETPPSESPPDEATPDVPDELTNEAGNVTPPPLQEISRQDAPRVAGIQIIPERLRSLLPPSLREPVAAVFGAVDSAVSPIPPSIATAIPYATIAFLIAFALVYIYQGIQEGKSRADLVAISKRFKQTESVRKSYIDLTSHYINTPIAKMQATVELLKTNKHLSTAEADSAMQRVQRLIQHARLVLAESQTLSKESSQALDALRRYNANHRSLLSAGFIIPLIGVLAITIIVNVIFVWAEKYDASMTNLAIQSGYYVLSALGLAAAYNTFRRKQLATKLIEQEIKLEKELTDSQSKFINTSAKTLQGDVLELEQLVPSISDKPKGYIFVEGLESLKDAITKMHYLNALTTHRTIPTLTDRTLKELAEEVIKEYSAYAKQLKVELKTEIEAGLTALVDVDGFKQLLGSTLDNAIKFNKPGGNVSLSITRRNVSTIQVIVADTGKGIEPERLDGLFIPFARGTDTAKYDFEGFGLDLYMDKLIAEQCGGKIKITSEKGIGTTVTITLPS